MPSTEAAVPLIATVLVPVAWALYPTATDVEAAFALYPIAVALFAVVVGS